MAFLFKHRYAYKGEIKENGIYYCDVKISYKSKNVFCKFVFCKKNILSFESRLQPKLKQLSIKQNLNDTVVIEIEPIIYLGKTMIE